MPPVSLARRNGWGPHASNLPPSPRPGPDHAPRRAGDGLNTIILTCIRERGADRGSGGTAAQGANAEQRLRGEAEMRRIFRAGGEGHEEGRGTGEEIAHGSLSTSAPSLRY